MTLMLRMKILMPWEPRPVPETTPETKEFWTAAADERYLLSECNNCDCTYYYPRAHCPECLSSDVEWQESSGRGTVYSYTILSRIDGWPDDDLPLVAAFVELEEGPRVMTNIVGCDPDNINIGGAVEVQFTPVEGDDIAVPVFSLANSDK